tara:strand:+ start:1019 stop:3577 length:2559 start_codon:yes stop_codon:yes gene_type:complete
MLRTIVDIPPDDDDDDIIWEMSDAVDIRSSHKDVRYFEAQLSVSQHKRLKFDESIQTFNDAMSPGELHMHQIQHKTHSAAWSILAIDIEAVGVDGFPDADVDPILQISCVFQPRNGDINDVQAWVLSTAPECSTEELDNFQFEQFDTEQKLLRRFGGLIRTLDPDMLTGWNVLNFDIKYILCRAKTLDITLGVGRDRSKPKTWKKESHTRAHGTRVTNMCAIHGRIVFDAMAAIQRDHNEPSYKLQAMSIKYLEAGKDDMPYDEILPCMDTLQGRRRVARYCCKDSMLVLQLLDYFKTVNGWRGIVAATGTPLNKVIHGGQQVRCWSTLAKYNEPRELDTFFAFPNVTAEETTDGYQGATVIEPKVGATMDAIATLDFAALYPNVMIAWNICWSTLHTCESKFKAVPSTMCTYHNTEITRNGETIRRALSIHDGQTMNGNCGEIAFTQDKAGLIPTVQQHLYTERKAIKRKMKELESKTSYEYNTLDAYQLALKLVMNSMYGLLGAKQGYLPNVLIASAITCIGRALIEWSRICANRHPSGLAVWGGDTDSIFVHAPANTCSSIQEYHEFWDTVAEEITGTYGHPALILEYEKMYTSEYAGSLSFIVIAKKRYAGWCFPAGEAHGKLVYTGLECKRRDFCPHLHAIMKTLLRDLFTTTLEDAMDNMYMGIKYIFQHHDEAETQSGFYLSKQYFKKADQYSNPLRMPHVQVAQRINANVGDRIQYIVAAPLSGALVSLADRAYAPDEFNKMDMKFIDIQYYFIKQIKNPLHRITEVINPTYCNTIWRRIRRDVGTAQRTVSQKLDNNGFSKLFGPPVKKNKRKHSIITSSTTIKQKQHLTSKSFKRFFAIDGS